MEFCGIIGVTSSNVCATMSAEVAKECGNYEPKVCSWNPTLLAFYPLACCQIEGVLKEAQHSITHEPEVLSSVKQAAPE